MCWLTLTSVQRNLARFSPCIQREGSIKENSQKYGHVTVDIVDQIGRQMTSYVTVK